MNELLKNRIDKAINLSEKNQKTKNSYSYIENIIELLIKMKKEINSSKERRLEISNALGRLITEDINFSESSLGSEILEISEAYINE